MWAFIEIFIFVVELLSLAPRNPKAGRRSAWQAPNWVRWPIYAVIVLAVLFLVIAWIVVLVV